MMAGSIKSTFGNNALATAAAGNSGAEFNGMNHDLIHYLSKTQPAVLQQLYQSSAACLAVFRGLPLMSQNFVLRLLFIGQPIPQAVVSSWVKTARFVSQSFAYFLILSHTRVPLTLFHITFGLAITLKRLRC